MELLSCLLDVPHQRAEQFSIIDSTTCIDTSTTNCVFRRQNPTLQIALEMELSSAFKIASTLRLPPTALRNADIAASVTSSFVCDESISETSVENR